MPITILLALFGLTWTTVGLAENVAPRTLLVAKDGSGQYTSIQEAVDAAGRGDTIRIRAGRTRKT